MLGPVNRRAAAAVQAALSAVDWTDPAGWRSVVASVHRQLRALRDVVPREVEPVLAQAVTDMMHTTRIACIADLTNKHRVRSRGSLAAFGVPDPETVSQLQRVRRVVVKQGWTEQITAFSDSARARPFRGWTRRTSCNAWAWACRPITHAAEPPSCPREPRDFLAKKVPDNR